MNRMSGNKIEIQLAHVLRQLRSGKFSLVEILKAGTADCVGTLDAWMTLESRRHRYDRRFFRCRPRRAGR